MGCQLTHDHLKSPYWGVVTNQKKIVMKQFMSILVMYPWWDEKSRAVGCHGEIRVGCQLESHDS